MVKRKKLTVIVQSPSSTRLARGKKVKGEKLIIHCSWSTRLSGGKWLRKKTWNPVIPQARILKNGWSGWDEDMIVHSSSSVRPTRDKVIKGKYMVVHSSSCVRPTRSRVIKDKYMIVLSPSSTRSSRGEVFDNSSLT